MKKWKINNRKEVFTENIFQIGLLECYHPDKNLKHNFHILKTMDWINVIAITEDDKFILVKQHRLGTDEFTIETPAGLIEKEENPEIAAKRELLEETGYVPEKIQLLKKLSANPSIMNNHIYFYLAWGCRKVSGQKLDSSEDIEILLLSAEDIQNMIKDGEINHSIIITALSLYFLSPLSRHKIIYY